CAREVHVLPPVHGGLTFDRLSECASSLRNRLDEAVRIEQIGRETMPLLEEIRDNLDDQARVNRAIARVDLLRAQMNDLAGAYHLITQLTQNTELRRFQADRKISAAKVEGMEKQRRQVQRDVDNVQGVIDASIEFQKLMRNCISEIDLGVEHSNRRAAA